MHHRFPSTSVAATAFVWGGVWLCVAIGLVVMQTTLGNPYQRPLPLLAHHLTKRSFFDIECKGVYDKSIFARLDRICEDCYNLFHEAELHSLCRSRCFSSQYFKGCLEALLLFDERDKIVKMVEFLGKKKRGD